MILKKADLKSASKKELLACVEEVKNEISGKTTEFKKYFGTDYDYNALTYELSCRGCVNGWYDPDVINGPSEVSEIVVDISDEIVRSTYALTRNTQKKYAKFLKDKKLSSAYTTAALTYFMDAMEAGKVKVKIEL